MRGIVIVGVLAIGCGVGEFESSEDLPEEPTLRLVSVTPNEIGITRATRITVAYEGAAPANQASVDDQDVRIEVDHATKTFSFVAYQSALGAVRFVVRSTEAPYDLVVADELFRVIELSAHATLSEVWNPTIAVPLRPELARPCARQWVATIGNTGDHPLSITGLDSTDPAFTLGSSCGPVYRDATCDVAVCFDSTEAGQHATTVTIHTTGGDVTKPLAATVLERTPDLDPDFHGGALLAQGWVPLPETTVLSPDGERLVVGNTPVVTVDASGAHASPYLGVMVRAVRSDATGTYVLIDDGSVATIRKIDERGVIDTTFNEPVWTTAGFPFELQGLERAGNRLLAIGNGAVFALANGALDPTFGTNGAFTFDTLRTQRASAIDAGGRLYIALDHRVIRLTAAGQLDLSFVFTHRAAALALDANRRLIVATADSVLRLDDRGLARLAIPLPDVRELAVDDSGRYYLTRFDGTVHRYAPTGVFDRTLGFGGASGVRCTAGPCWVFGEVTPLEERYVSRFVE